MNVDKKLLDNCKKMKERWLYKLYAQCSPYMAGVCSRYLHDSNDIPSVVNQSFYKIVKNLSKYDQQRPFKPWIARITANCCLDHIRSNNSLPHFEEITDQQATNTAVHRSVDLDLQIKDEHDYVHEVLSSLPKQTAIVFNFFAIESFTHKEIADKLGISEGTSKWHVASARQQLKKALSINSNTIDRFEKAGNA